MMRQLLTHLRTPALIAVVVVIFDQFTKALVLRTWPLPQTGEIPIIGQWLTLTYIRNDGVAFGMFQGIPQFFTVTSLLIMAGAIYYYLRHLTEHDRWSALMLGLIIGGAFGNVIDRVRFGYVVDFIKTFGGHFPVFNVADSSVCVGVALMAIRMLVQDYIPDRRLLAKTDDGS
jgi:signal peptidase II